MISGTTALVAHMGYPTYAFKSPMVYNPWFEKQGVDAIVVPMGIEAEDYPDLLRVGHQDDQRPWRAGDHAAQGRHHGTRRRGQPDRRNRGRRQHRDAAGGRVAGRRSVRRRRLRSWSLAEGIRPPGTGARGRQRQGRLSDRGLAGGIGLAGIGLFDPNAAASEGLAQRIGKHYPAVEVAMGSKDPEGYDLIVNATPIGMKDDDPLPSTSTGSHPVLTSGTWCSKPSVTPFLQAAKDKGCIIQIGQRHAVRDDSRLSGVLRLRQCHAGGIAHSCAAVVVTEGYLTSYREIVGWAIVHSLVPSPYEWWCAWLAALRTGRFGDTAQRPCLTASGFAEPVMWTRSRTHPG